MNKKMISIVLSLMMLIGTSATTLAQTDPVPAHEATEILIQDMTYEEYKVAMAEENAHVAILLASDEDTHLPPILITDMTREEYLRENQKKVAEFNAKNRGRHVHAYGSK